MATVYERKNLNGTSSWRVQIRRKGCPKFCLSFDTEKCARDWVSEHEPKFLKDSSLYSEHIDKISFLNNREREIKRNERMDKR